MKGLIKRIEQSYKDRLPLYKELGLEMHSNPVWVYLPKQGTHPTVLRDDSPIVEGADE